MDKIHEDGTFSPVNPKLFKKFLKSEKLQFIAFSSQTDSKYFLSIKEMLANLHYPKEKITTLTFCQSCLNENKFNILDKGTQIESLKSDLICPNCAIELILKRAKTIGLIKEERYSLKLKGFLTHLVLKFKSVKKVLDSFKPNFDPAQDKEITLYDVEESPAIGKKYLNYPVNKLAIPDAFKKNLNDLNIKKLLPIQSISIEEGLLSKYNNQLIMAPTSGGKTLVGELAGISKVLKQKNTTMLYLVPIVALANVRTDEFIKKYASLNLNIIKKVGESLIDAKDVRENLENLPDADIIIATYEAIDYILRSGNKQYLTRINTVVIDEIQTLIDPERGFILDGLIARLKILFPEAQFLYLSATIGEPQLLANRLESKLIRYNSRPVPIERHLILCVNDNVKKKYITKLVRKSFSEKSRYNYRGQSIIFTNTRKKCENLSEYLQRRGLKVKPYHSGLTNEERNIVEFEFQQQRISGVVATAALAAGVDFPARQVIFESLAMGINWLSVAEFEQMLGRAGRLKKHDLGFTYLLVEPGKIYSPKMKHTEETIAIRLLNGKIKDFELTPDEDRSLTELLAFVSVFNQSIDFNLIDEYYGLIINNKYNLNSLLEKLGKLELIEKKVKLFNITQLGQAIAKSFLTIDQSLDIVKEFEKNEKDPIELVLDLKPLRNVYLSKSIVADLSKNRNMKYFSNNLFSASVLSLMNAEYVRKRKKFSDDFINFITKWTTDIFNCRCKDNPYCDCGRINLEKIIFNLRIEEKMSVSEICAILEKDYKIFIFRADIYGYLENLIYSFESVKNIIKGIPALKTSYNSFLSNIPKIVENIKQL
ncbi:MAG: DEAD/DEAH box helicase [Candidatus Lokiarchaeota archaeon]|nr:DEAD/DEAH box helicase [Candidatus Lokiarchaeota archaeon]